MRKKSLKRLFVLATAFAVSFSGNVAGFTENVSAADVVLQKIGGDVNGDNAVDIKDSALLKRHLAGWNVEIDKHAADVNNDSQIDIKDSALLKRHLAGWEVSLLYGNSEDNKDADKPSDGQGDDKDTDKSSDGQGDNKDTDKSSDGQEDNQDKEITATDITLDKTDISMTVGDSITLKATVSPENTTDSSVSWMSDDTSVANVKDGVVEAIKTGATTITAITANGIVASCKVTVKEPDEILQDEEAVYQALFDINNKVSINMDISDEQIKLMEQDYKSGDRETYRKADTVTITINHNTYTIEEVGVRIKGNTSRVDIYNNNNVNDRNLIHFKLNFKETFDDEVYGDDAKVWSDDAARKERKNRTFATLSKLELKWNRNLDGTYVANTYVNQMYRAFGVYAQNTSLANVRFGGYNYGVYTMYEPVDDNFLTRYFGKEEDDGDLYKCQWGLKNNGSGNDWSGATYLKDTLNSMSREVEGKTYIYELKTNKKKSTQESLKNLINTLNNDASKETFGKIMDAENWVMYAAVAYFAGNPDDMRNNYNNHFIYFNNASGLAYVLPYDNDRCLGMTTSGKNMTEFSPYASDTALQGTQRSPLYNNSVVGRSSNHYTEYTTALKKVADSEWLNYDNYLKYYQAAKENYEDVAVPDSHVKAYVKDLNTTFHNSKLAFSEANGVSGNMTVKNFMTKILERYQTAMNK